MAQISKKSSWETAKRKLCFSALGWIFSSMLLTHAWSLSCKLASLWGLWEVGTEEECQDDCVATAPCGSRRLSKAVIFMSRLWKDNPSERNAWSCLLTTGYKQQSPCSVAKGSPSCQLSQPIHSTQMLTAVSMGSQLHV